MTTAAVYPNGGEGFFGALERDDLDIIEATLSWGGDVLEVRHLPMGSAVSVGEHAECTFFIPASAARLGTDLALVLAAGSTDLGRDRPVDVELGPFRVILRVVPAGRHIPFGALASLKESALGSVGTSFVVHAMILGSLAMFLPSLGADDDEAIARDRLYTMQKYLAGAAERERDQALESVSADDGSRESGAAGTQALGESGAMGRANTPKTDGHWSAKGNATPQDATLAREHQMSLVRDFGLLGLLASSPLSDPDAPAAPWGTVPNGADSESHIGAMWGVDARDNWGIGGLGLSGVGEGGCPPGAPNCGQGVGLRDFGGLGRALRGAMGNCSGPNCDDKGSGHGILPGAHTVRVPNPRMCGDETCGFETNGRIPPEVIQRIVRQNAGRYRACYEQGLRDNPSLNGHVRVKFVIDRGGAVSAAQDSGSDMPDEKVRSCVVKSFFALAFPSPAGGTVRVVYPILFSPTE